MERKRSIEEVRYYVTPSPWWDVVRVLVFLAFTGFFILISTVIDELAGRLIPAALEALVTFLIVRAFKNAAALDDENTVLFYSGEQQDVLDDFVTGTLFFENKLILGRKFMFSYHMGRVIRYSNVKSVYLRIYKRGFFETKRFLLCEVEEPGGRSYNLEIARLYRSKEMDDEANRVASMICAANPNVRIGYNT